MTGKQVKVGFGTKMMCPIHKDEPLRSMYTNRRRKGKNQFEGTCWRMCDKCGVPVKVEVDASIVGQAK